MQTSRKRPTTAVRRSVKPTVAAKAREIVAWLRRRRDPAQARGVQQYFRHEIAALGIDTPTLRRFAKHQTRPLADHWSLADAVSLCDRLLRQPELEVRSMGMLILGAFKRRFSLALTNKARPWLETRLDNWALVDMFCSSVLSPLFEQYPEMQETLRQWSRASSLWVRRAAVVTLVPFARRGRLLDMTYAMAQERFADPEDLIHKAVGWLLREAGKTDMDRLRQFLLRHGPTIPRTTLRYAIERFPLVERRKLLVATRGPLMPMLQNSATGARGLAQPRGQGPCCGAKHAPSKAHLRPKRVLISMNNPRVSPPRSSAPRSVESLTSSTPQPNLTRLRQVSQVKDSRIGGVRPSVNLRHGVDVR